MPQQQLSCRYTTVPARAPVKKQPYHTNKDNDTLSQFQAAVYKGHKEGEEESLIESLGLPPDFSLFDPA
jgi:hypothetical protein